MSTPTFNSRARLDRLRNRRQGPVTLFTENRSQELYEKLMEDDAVKYLVGSMQPIDPEYTKNTFAEAERVKAQLEANYPSKGVGAEFDYQGSVTNDTHIFRYSDIDLLTVTKEFVFNEVQPAGATTYRGNAALVLLNQHNASVSIIGSKFPGVTVDTSSGKAIKLSGGSLRRKIDVVTCTWWNTVEYSSSPVKYKRGIKVFDTKTHVQIENKPFLHNFNIEIKDSAANGNLRKVIRMLKTVKADANEDASYQKVDISSYDICAIAYSMGFDRLAAGAEEELKLAYNAQRYLDYLEQNSVFRDSLMVPNGTRRIFCSEGASLAGLQQLNRELKSVLDEITAGFQRSYRTVESRLRRG